MRVGRTILSRSAVNDAFGFASVRHGDSSMIPAAIIETIERADPSWRPILQQGLLAVEANDPAYLQILAADQYLPTQGRLLAAFAQPLEAIRYVLIGEGPYPRERSATGVCFMDGAVDQLWSENGLSTSVNRATSLRNFIKMLLVAQGDLQVAQTSGVAMLSIGQRAQSASSGWIQTLPELQMKLTQRGFLLLNAALVFRPHIASVKEAKAWLPFLQTILNALAERPGLPPTLVLWGKIAAQVDALQGVQRFTKAVAEHPYNLSFIGNMAMQQLFGPMHLLLRGSNRFHEG